jgi:ribosomal protein S12 methylthiotransferase
MYAYPATMTDGILEAIAGEAKVVKYVDMPLQHASDAVLKRMKRPTGRGNLLGMVERVRRKVPGVAFRTSVIVGFPGETKDEFAELLAFVKEAHFDHLGVFTYSDEEGTTSFDLAGRVPARVKESRRNRVLALQSRLSARRNRARVGERLEVLVEGTHPDTDLLLRGRAATQAPDVDGAILINDGTAAPGTFVTCQVTEAHPYDLVARIVQAPSFS